MKIVWNKIDFNNFTAGVVGFFDRRRVDEIPAYLKMIGFGFSIVEPIRQGYWIHPESGEIFIGFMKSGSNFHYFGAYGTQRSSADYPEPALEPVDFVDGYYEFQAQKLQYFKQDMLPVCQSCGQNPAMYQDASMEFVCIECVGFAHKPITRLAKLGRKNA